MGSIDILFDIFPYLERNELEKSQLVASSWNKIITKNIAQKLNPRRRLEAFTVYTYRRDWIVRSNEFFI